ncbi:nuclear receptor subfamily 1 group I member 2 [Aplochiton taeniatus]
MRHPEKAEEEEEEEEEQPKICQVCGDQATGYHFNALTCEGCKGFFRRAMKQPMKLRCPAQNNCVITKRNRRQCQPCRLRKCQVVGMLKELIMSDEAVEKRRTRIRKKKMVDVPQVLTPQQEATIQELLAAHHKTFDVTFSLFNKFRPLDRNLNPLYEYSRCPDKPREHLNCHSSSGRKDYSSGVRSSTSPNWPSSSSSSDPGDKEEKGDQDGLVFTTLPHLADLTTYMIQNIINFAKGLPSFRALSMEDQISLLKGATFDLIQIRFNMVFNAQTGIWECGALTYCMGDAVRAGFQHHLLDPLMHFHYHLKNLGLLEEEYVLMQAISLFSPDRVGVTNHNEIDALQERLALTLKMHIECKRSRPDKCLLYPKVMACLTEMRSMNEEHTKQWLRIQDVQPDVSPLILEVVSKDP